MARSELVCVCKVPLNVGTKLCGRCTGFAVVLPDPTCQPGSVGNMICVDDDCPLPEHMGPCPDERTLEMWRTEAKRCRVMIGRLLLMVKSRDDSIASYRALVERLNTRRREARIAGLREAAAICQIDNVICVKDVESAIYGAIRDAEGGGNG